MNFLWGDFQFFYFLKRVQVICVVCAMSWKVELVFSLLHRKYLTGIGIFRRVYLF